MIKLSSLNLIGKIVITGIIEAKTGLHIGSSQAGLNIGGVDLSVVRDAEGKPYLPGSSLKGKIRSLLEKAEGKDLNKVVSSKQNIRIHECDGSPCEICKIFGMAGEKKDAEPTRLMVRDAFLDETSLKDLKTDLPYSEVKWEAVIDRITSAAMPRQIERVPAGAKFVFEIVYNVFEEQDKLNLKKVFEAMNLLEHDYLGGHGSRGYGKVKFDDIEIHWNPKSYYESGDKNKQVQLNNTEKGVEVILQNFNTLIHKTALNTAK